MPTSDKSRRRVSTLNPENIKLSKTLSRRFIKSDKTETPRKRLEVTWSQTKENFKKLWND